MRSRSSIPLNSSKLLQLRNCEAGPVWDVPWEAKASGVTLLRGISDLGSSHWCRILHDPTILLCGWVHGKNAEQATLERGKIGNSEQAFSIQVVPLSFVGLFSYRTILLVWLFF